MKNLIAAAISTLIFTTLMISCSDDFYGIEFDLISPTDLNISSGQEEIFSFKASDDIGISQIKITQPRLGLYIDKIFDNPILETTFSFAAYIPTTLSNSEISISVDLIDTDNNQLTESIKLSIQD